MAVVKKRRTYQSKSARQSQQNRQQSKIQNIKSKHDFEDKRLKSDQLNTIVHDESDTISFRSHILKNFIKSTDYMNALTLKPVTLNNVIPPTIFGKKDIKISINEMETKINKELKILENLKQRLNENSDNAYYKVPNFELELLNGNSLNNTVQNIDFTSIDSIDKVLSLYQSKYNLKIQDHKVVKYENKFVDLKIDRSEAPPDYWANVNELKRKQLEKKKIEHSLLLKREQEKRQEKEEEERRRKQKMAEEEALMRNKQQEQERLEQHGQQQKSQQQDFIRQQQQQKELVSGPAPQSLPQPQIATTVYAPAITAQSIQEAANPQSLVGSTDNSMSLTGQSITEANTIGTTSNEISAVDNQTNIVNGNTNSQQNLLDDMFGEYDNEPFNNGFDDGFGDLDNVFF